MDVVNTFPICLFEPRRHPVYNMSIFPFPQPDLGGLDGMLCDFGDETPGAEDACRVGRDLDAGTYLERWISGPTTSRW